METLTDGDPTTGRAMTAEDGYAGRLVVDLRNLVSELRKEPPPNRFDPYEALDRIDELRHRVQVAAQGVIDVQVGLLRAYITGMER